MKHDAQEQQGFILGLIAVSSFSLTLPMTRFAVGYLDPALVGFGRAFIAALAAAIILLIKGERNFPKAQLGSLIWVSVGISLGFPFLSAVAMRFLPASHGAIVTGLLPMATAYCVTLFNHESPSRSFWISAFAGTVLVTGYALIQSHGRISWADILLLVAVILGALGYAQGAIAAKTLGGVRVMCWALVLAMPLLAVISIPLFLRQDWHGPLTAVGAFAYLTFVSQLFGMVLWYKALSSGSISRISQVQLIQPFLTIFFASVLFGEPVGLLTWFAALGVVASIHVSRKSSILSNS